jgi:glucose/mannose transport system permease protein
MIALLILLPSIALVGYFVYACIGWNVLVSLTNWDHLKPSYEIIGFGQYSALFKDPIFWTSLENNLILIFLFVPSSIGLGLFLAILLDNKVRGEGIFRTIYLLPFALSFVITGSLWKWMYDSSNGVINTLLRGIGLGFWTPMWVGDSSIAMYCVVLGLVWQFSGYTMLLFLAGIRSIPESQVMAAEIDGARGFRLYRRIIIPQLKSSTLATFVILMVFSLKAFDFIYILTGGKPGYSTFVLALMMYQDTFSSDHYAYGAAIATVLFLIVMVIVVPYLYLSSRRREE